MEDETEDRDAPSDCVVTPQIFPAADAAV